MDRSSPAFRIGELARRTGVAVPTLRAWELRYRLLRPSRTVGGQRLYSVDDEQRVLEVCRLVGSGVAVGPAARSVASASAGTPVGSRSAEPRSTSGSLRAGGGVAVAARTAATRLTLAPDDDPATLVHTATRSLLHAGTAVDVVGVLCAFVERLGGTVAPAATDPGSEDIIPVDLACGEGPPMVPRADPMSVARIHLERALPELVEDGRRIITLLRHR